jgi:peroxiredoxin
MAMIPELFNDAKFILRFRVKEGRVHKKLDQQAPKAGDLAPDFTLGDVSGAVSVTLSEFRGEKPVALIFGSFT